MMAATRLGWYLKRENFFSSRISSSNILKVREILDVTGVLEKVKLCVKKRRECLTNENKNELRGDGNAKECLVV